VDQPAPTPDKQIKMDPIQTKVNPSQFKMDSRQFIKKEKPMVSPTPPPSNNIHKQNIDSENQTPPPKKNVDAFEMFCRDSNLWGHEPKEPSRNESRILFKKLSPEKLKYYIELATEDKRRYRAEMDAYTIQTEIK